MEVALAEEEMEDGRLAELCDLPEAGVDVDRRAAATVNFREASAPAAPVTASSQPRLECNRATGGAATPRQSGVVRPKEPTGAYPDLSASIMAAAGQMMEAQRVTHAHQIVTERRPREKFSGDTEKTDFKEHMKRFEGLAKIPGASDELRLRELEHWFSGKAGLIADQYTTAEDPVVGLAKAKVALTEEFGQERETARRMLDRFLQGEKLAKKESDAIQEFVINIERVYRAALETGRGGSFNEPEICEDIIRMKLPHLSEEWAKKAYRKANSTEGKVGGGEEKGFEQFIAFVREKYRVEQWNSRILRNPLPGTTRNTATSSRPSLLSTSATVPQGFARGGGIECPNCPQFHHLSRCPGFRAMPVADRWVACRKQGVCFRCLGTRHTARQCQSQAECSECRMSHDVLLHHPTGASQSQGNQSL